VHQFNDAGGAVGGFADVSAGLGRQEDKQGAHLLAFALHNVVGNGVEQGHIAFHGQAEPLLKFLHFGPHHILYLVNP
jgi:hypothetical protein